MFLEGEINFDLTCKDIGERIKDSYIIRILFPEDYPENPPEVEEIGGKIANNFHKNGQALCLETPSQVYLIFKENLTLENFIKALLEPYLYAHSYSKKHNGKMPFGHSHGGKGLIEFYSEVFSVKDDEIIIDFLELIIKKNYKQSMPCPCKSGKKIKKCHIKALLSRYNKVPNHIIEYELMQIKKEVYGFKI